MRLISKVVAPHETRFAKYFPLLSGHLQTIPLHTELVVVSCVVVAEFITVVLMWVEQTTTL